MVVWLLWPVLEGVDPAVPIVLYNAPRCCRVKGLPRVEGLAFGTLLLIPSSNETSDQQPSQLQRLVPWLGLHRTLMLYGSNVLEASKQSRAGYAYCSRWYSRPSTSCTQHVLN